MGYQTMDSEICPTFKKKETQFGTPEIKGNLHLDEKYINVKGKYCYDLNVIDRKTKFVLSELFVRQRTISKCKTLLNKIKMWCYQQIMLLYRQGLTVIKFVADKAGVFTFACGLPYNAANGQCDPDHSMMTGTLIVLE